MSKGTNPGQRPPRDQVLLKRTLALEARRDGKTWDATAAYAGYSNGPNARRAVLALLDDHAAETVDQYRTLNTLRLERLLLRVTPLALAGNLAATAEARKLIAELSRLQGSYMPTKIEVTTEMDRQIEELARRVQQMDQSVDIIEGPEVTTEEV